jgi:hypothetical protein
VPFGDTLEGTRVSVQRAAVSCAARLVYVITHSARLCVSV